MTLAQINIRLADILIALGVFAVASAVFFGGIGWAFTYFGSDRFRWSRFAAVSAMGLAFAVLTGIAVSHLGVRAAEFGSEWYSPDIAAWIGLPAALVSYILAVGLLSRWPQPVSVLKTRWWSGTLLLFCVATTGILLELARPRTDGELMAAIANRKDFDQRSRANQIIADRGTKAAHLAPQLQEIIDQGTPSTTVWEMQTLAAIAPNSETVLLLEKMAQRPYPAPAINVLGKLGPAARPALPTLLDLLELRPGEIALDPQVAAARAVREIDPQQVHDPRYQSTMQEIMERLSDDDPRRRQGAAQQLGRIGSGATASLPVLQEMARSDPDARCRKAAAASVRAIQADAG